ncbi:adenine phosphoribosyltransferase [Brienomyrus brachyistius]|uniref:adenine phosphoribosyltransferase n=1 Tax=Brienomyrus brachyistius TaxID=42636 RepID=UPI0020B1B7B5|nr:adenine phosphoribosyltransferase [Brienomyrus brachyistius]
MEFAMGNGTHQAKIELIARNIRNFPDFPVKGIQFKDVCPVLKEPSALSAVVDLFEEHTRQTFPQVDIIAGIEARGFFFGPLLAQRLGVGFVPIRKKGKLPGPTASLSYTIEYGEDVVEIQEDAVTAGQKVILIDDLLATGGTMQASCKLLEKYEAEVLGCFVIIKLKDLKGEEKLHNYKVFSLLQY